MSWSVGVSVVGLGARPLPDLNGPEGAAGSAVFNWMDAVLRLTHQVVQRVFSEYEPLTAAGVAQPGEPAAGNAVLFSIVAVVIAVAALGWSVLTRRQLGVAR